jgi:hypothetical protein
MPNRRHDGFYFLQGMTVTFAVLGAVMTIGAGFLVLMIAVAPRGLAEPLRQAGGRTLEGDVMLAAFIQTVGWFWLPRIHFVSSQLGRRMMITMGILTFLMFGMVVVALF